MGAESVTEMNERGEPVAQSRGLFVLTILTGSFLLFLVQPLLARMALLKLGGAPAITWRQKNETQARRYDRHHPWQNTAD